MRKHMEANVNFRLPVWAKEKLWRLCQERGLLPSQVVREAVIRAIDQLEREISDRRRLDDEQGVGD